MGGVMTEPYVWCADCNDGGCCMDCQGRSADVPGTWCSSCNNSHECHCIRRPRMHGIPEGLRARPAPSRWTVHCSHCGESVRGYDQYDDYVVLEWRIDELTNLRSYEPHGWQFNVDGRAAVCGDCFENWYCDGCGEARPAWDIRNQSRKDPDVNWCSDCFQDDSRAQPMEMVKTERGEIANG